MVSVRRLAVLGAWILMTATLPSAPAVAATTIRLDGVRVALQRGTTKVVTVNRTRSWHARGCPVIAIGR
jgi:hypothetical protein